MAVSNENSDFENHFVYCRHSSSYLIGLWQRGQCSVPSSPCFSRKCATPSGLGCFLRVVACVLHLAKQSLLLFPVYSSTNYIHVDRQSSDSPSSPSLADTAGVCLLTLGQGNAFSLFLFGTSLVPTDENVILIALISRCEWNHFIS